MKIGWIWDNGDGTSTWEIVDENDNFLWYEIHSNEETEILGGCALRVFAVLGFILLMIILF